ncbi:uncharacterized protein LOC134234611 [Saccostrea cucullata]
MGDKLPDITSIDTAGPSASGTPSPSPMPSGWSEKAENCLLDFFREVSKQPVKNKWLKIAGKMKDIGFDYSSEQCRLKIKSLKERHARLSKKRCTSGEGGVEDVLEDKMAETFSTPDCKPLHISESGKGNSDAQSSSDTSDEKLQPVAKKVKKCEQRPTVMDILERAEKESEKRHKEKNGNHEGMSKMVKKE